MFALGIINKLRNRARKRVSSEIVGRSEPGVVNFDIPKQDLVRQIEQETSRRQIEWESTPDIDAYLAFLTNAIARMQRTEYKQKHGPADSKGYDYVLQIFEPNGTLRLLIAESELRQQIEPEPPEILLYQLFQQAGSIAAERDRAVFERSRSGQSMHD